MKSPVVDFAADLLRQDGEAAPGDVRSLAMHVLQPATLVEHSCYDERGRDQGVALMRFTGWIDKSLFQFPGVHMGQLRNTTNGGHQISRKRRQPTTSVKQREQDAGPQWPWAQNITKWRLVSPISLMGQVFGEAIGFEEIRTRLEGCLAQFPPIAPLSAPAGPSREAGGAINKTGLDEAFVKMSEHYDPRFEEVMKLAQRAQAKKVEKKDEAKKRPDRAFGNILLG